MTTSFKLIVLRLRTFLTLNAKTPPNPEQHQITLRASAPSSLQKDVRTNTSKYSTLKIIQKNINKKKIPKIVPFYSHTRLFVIVFLVILTWNFITWNIIPFESFDHFELNIPKRNWPDRNRNASGAPALPPGVDPINYAIGAALGLIVAGLIALWYTKDDDKKTVASQNKSSISDDKLPSTAEQVDPSTPVSTIPHPATPPHTKGGFQTVYQIIEETFVWAWEHPYKLYCLALLVFFGVVTGLFMFFSPWTWKQRRFKRKLFYAGIVFYYRLPGHEATKLLETLAILGTRNPPIKAVVDEVRAEIITTFKNLYVSSPSAARLIKIEKELVKSLQYLGPDAKQAVTNALSDVDVINFRQIVLKELK